MRRLFLLLSLLTALAAALWSPAFAAQVGGERARTVAENYLRHVVETFHRWDGNTPGIRAVTPVHYNGALVFWHVQLEPTGYLLVSSRDELSPVKVYSEQGVFDPARVDTPSAPESWIIPEQYFSVEAVSNPAKTAGAAADTTAAQQIGLAWQVFGRTGPESARMAVQLRSAQTGPLITALWAQDDPYNRQTPTISGEHTLVGCVATAWSMLLRHWQWPDRGRGVKTHAWEGQTFTVDFSEQAWDWSVMPDELTAASPQAAIDAVSRLAFQVGVAAEMNWGLEASGSNLYADEVFHIYFKYKDAMSQIRREDVSAADWFNHFKTEFDSSPARPIVMSIFGTLGGHEILADGYQTGATNKVHLNMGWAGSHNAWYDVTSDFATGGYTWDAMQSVIVIGIEPDGAPSPDIPWKTEVGVVNLAAGDTTGVLRGFDAAGAQVWSRDIHLPSQGRESLDVTEAAGSATAALIKSMRLDITGGAAVGYQKFYQSGKYRVGLEALSRANQNGLYLPHIHSDSNWWTGVGLVNTTSSAKSLGFSFSNGAQASRSVDAGGHDSFVINGPFQGTATVSNGAGIAGILLFGTSNQLSGISLRDDTAYTLYFPHVDESSGWWTGAGTYNPNPTQTSITLYGYGQGGNLIGTNAFSIDPYSSHVASTSFGSSVAWFKLESSQPILGFELFGKTTADQLAGYSVTGLNTYQGVFPKLETSGWTGLAFVNIGSATANITLEARNNGGSVIATRTATLAPNAKSVALAEQFFPGQDCSSATYVRFTSDQPLIGFQLNGSSDGTMLDAIPALGSSATYGSSALYFPHIAAE